MAFAAALLPLLQRDLVVNHDADRLDLGFETMQPGLEAALGRPRLVLHAMFIEERAVRAVAKNGVAMSAVGLHRPTSAFVARSTSTSTPPGRLSNTGSPASAGSCAARCGAR